MRDSARHCLHPQRRHRPTAAAFLLHRPISASLRSIVCAALSLRIALSAQEADAFRQQFIELILVILLQKIKLSRASSFEPRSRDQPHCGSAMATHSESFFSDCRNTTAMHRFTSASMRRFQHLYYSLR